MREDLKFEEEETTQQNYFVINFLFKYLFIFLSVCVRL